MTEKYPDVHPRPLAIFHPNLLDLEEDGARWSARASRKRRHPPKPARLPCCETKHPLRARAQGATLRLRFTPLNTFALWVAMMFTLGSVAWVVNAHLLFLPLASPSPPEHQAATAWSAFVGGTLFELGAYLAYVEALNSGHEEIWKTREQDADNMEKGSAQAKETPKRRTKWIGFGPWCDLGFAASAIQMAAATIFWISTITGLPGVIPDFPDEPPVGLTDGVYWTPQVIGGVGFVIASLLLMREEQRSWWQISPIRIGWQVAFWNLIGAIGFMLCGALGYASESSGAEYQSALSTYWGSWAFLIGSIAQIVEAVWRE